MLIFLLFHKHYWEYRFCRISSSEEDVYVCKHCNEQRDIDSMKYKLSENKSKFIRK